MRINKYNTLKGNDNVPQLVKEMSTNYTACNSFSEPDSICDMMCNVFHSDKQTEEICHILCFNTKMKLQGVFEISRGTVNISLINPREVFMKALLCGAVYIILVHNHPSGDITPSKEDVEVTKRIKEAGNLIGITLLDHIVIGDESYYSFMEHNCI